MVNVLFISEAVSFLCSGKFLTISYFNILLPASSPFLFRDTFFFLLFDEFFVASLLQLFGDLLPAKRRGCTLSAGGPSRSCQPGTRSDVSGFQILSTSFWLDFIDKLFPSRDSWLIKCPYSLMIENKWMSVFTPGPFGLGIIFITLSFS